jgi:FkbM family methyltransferase
MLIDPKDVVSLLTKHNITARGILHVGAHLCEEKAFYNQHLGLDDEKQIWVDANEDLVKINKNNGIPHCYTAVLDETERNVVFKITNNGQSSSILDFGTHKASYPHIYVTQERNVRTQTLSNFFKNTNLDPKNYNFWNFDIQGSELHVFRGSPELLQYADVIYTEVNTADVYKGCGQLQDLDTLLLEHGLKRVMIHMTGQNWGDAIYVRV